MKPRVGTAAGRLTWFRQSNGVEWLEVRQIPPADRAVPTSRDKRLAVRRNDDTKRHFVSCPCKANAGSRIPCSDLVGPEPRRGQCLAVRRECDVIDSGMGIPALGPGP